MSDDENDSCVLIGTPLLDLIPEDVKFSVKPKRPDEQVVTDEKGRQRFHGAFTGGFSAGYFNSVGSKEGWAPSTFKSTRSERSNSKQSQQRPEDFMDDEDFTDHGIAPKNLKVSVDYSINKTEKSTSKLIDKSNFLFDDLIKPTRNTIGIKMLRKMGWKEGQGIGPKIKRNLRKHKLKLEIEPGKKIYGVALPSDSDESENDDFDFFVSTFDVNEFQYEVKEDFFGLGYKRLDVSNMFGRALTTGGADESPAASLLFPMTSAPAKKSIRGQAFGVGEFEDEEDDDVYKQDSYEKYDFDLDAKKNKEAKNMLNKSYGFGAFDNDLTLLQNYAKSKQQTVVRTFAPPEILPGFNLIHTFANNPPTAGVVPQSIGNVLSSTDSDAMHQYLNTIAPPSSTNNSNFVDFEPSGTEEPKKPRSVFDLLNASDREFILKKKLEQTTSEKKGNSNNEQADLRKENVNDSLLQEKEAELRKSERYGQFKAYMLKNYKDPYSCLDSKDLTEWEKQKEKEMFYKMHENQHKVEIIKKEAASKFVSTSLLNEQNQELAVEKKVDEDVKATNTTDDDLYLNDMQKAAKMKKYGALTRVTYEWVPHPSLCKRFNVPNPHPGVKEYGTIDYQSNKRNTQKFSILDLMTSVSRFDREKPSNLFDEINSNAPAQFKPSFAKTITLSSNTNEPKSEKAKIEFDTKDIGGSSQITDIDRSIILNLQAIKAEVVDNAATNIYLQERPETDIFKTIFEDDNDEDDNSVETDHEYNFVDANVTEVKASLVADKDINDIRQNLHTQHSTHKPATFDVAALRQLEQKEAVISLTSSSTAIKIDLKKSLDKPKSSDSSESEEEDEIVYEEVSLTSKRSKSHHKKNKKHKKKSKKHKK